jgi:hypothetical protein
MITNVMPIVNAEGTIGVLVLEDVLSDSATLGLPSSVDVPSSKFSGILYVSISGLS